MSCPVNAIQGHLKHLVNDLVQDVPGSDLLALRYLQRAAAEFFRESARWMMRYDVPAQQSNKLTINNHEVLKVMQVVYDGDFLKERRLNTEIDTDHRYINHIPDELDFTFEPTKASEAIVAVTLADDNYEVDPSLLSRYRQSILTGAKSMLLMIGGKDFTDQNRGALEEAKFQQAIQKAWSDANRFLGYKRKYYGEIQYYGSQLVTGNNIPAIPNHELDTLKLDLDEANATIGEQVARMNQLNSRQNETFLAAQAAHAAVQENAVRINEISLEGPGFYGQGTLQEMLNAEPRKTLWHCTDDNENAGLYTREPGKAWREIDDGEAQAYFQESHYGQGSLTQMLAAPITKTLWDCTDQNENNGLWRRSVGGEWRKADDDSA